MVGNPRPHRRTRCWACARGRSRPNSSRRTVASCGPARDSARGLQLIIGVWPRLGRLAAARTPLSGQLASAISFCIRRNRAARSPCLTNVSSPGHVQILTRTSLESAIDFHRAQIYFARIVVVAVLATHTLRDPYDAEAFRRVALRARCKEHTDHRSIRGVVAQRRNIRANSRLQVLISSRADRPSRR